MDIEDIRKICLALPGTTEGIKWGNDLCFCVAGKMYCATGLSGPLTISFKVGDEEFAEVSCREGFIPAPYVARYRWVLLEEPKKISRKELQSLITKSYGLVKARLSKKVLKEKGLL